MTAAASAGSSIEVGADSVRQQQVHLVTRLRELLGLGEHALLDLVLGQLLALGVGPELLYHCLTDLRRAESQPSKARWALLDAPQHRRELIDFLAALELSLIPPGGTGIDERPDHVACLGGVTGTDAPEDDLEGAALLIATVLVDIRNQVADLIDRRNVTVPGGGEQRDCAIPARCSPHRSTVRPESGDPNRRPRALHRNGQ